MDFAARLSILLNKKKRSVTPVGKRPYIQGGSVSTTLNETTVLTTL